MGKCKLSLKVAIAGLVILASLAILNLFEPLPLIYYINISFGPHELPTKLIRPAFKVISGHKLPAKADSLRALCWRAGRDSCIFVRFETDADGIAYILKTFGGPSAKI